MWHGPGYHWLPISIDVVPTIQFPSNWMPPWANQHQLLIENGCCAVAKDIDQAPGDLRPYIMQLCFTAADGEFMRTLSKARRHAYMLAKILRHPAICKPKINWKTYKTRSVSEHITSYMLKTCLFRESEEDELKADLSSNKFDAKDKTAYLKEVGNWTTRIYTRLIRILDQRVECLQLGELEESYKHKLEVFYFPGEDILKKTQTLEWFQYARECCQQILEIMSKP